MNKDRLIMDNYLLDLKSCVEVYVHGTLESSNADIRNLLKHCLDEIMQDQADTYDLMSKCGWYPVNNVDKKTIKQTLTKVCQENQG